MSCLPDSNILLRLVNKNDPNHLNVRQSIKKLEIEGEELVVIPQVLVEFWVVATRPVDVNGLGMGPDEAEVELEKLQNLFPVLSENEDIFIQWRALVTTLKISGKPSHDARIAAAMMVYDVDKILTFNTGHYKRFTKITALRPQDILQKNGS